MTESIRMGLDSLIDIALSFQDKLLKSANMTIEEIRGEVQNLYTQM